MLCPKCSLDDQLVQFCWNLFRVTACTRCGWDDLREQALESRKDMLRRLEHMVVTGQSIEDMTFEETEATFKRLTDEGDEAFFQRLCG